MKKIKVAFIADMLVENLDGAIRTMYHLINRIPKDQFEFLFLCGSPPKRDIGFKVVSLPTTPLPINLSYNMAIPYLAEGKMKRSLQAFQPDILHISTPSPLGHFALNYGNTHQIPVVSIYHTHFLTYVDYYLRKVPLMIPPIKQKIIQYTQAFYNRCQLTLVPTQNIIDELAGYGVEKNKMMLWQRGINKKLFHPSKKNPERMRQLVGNDRPNLLFASRLVWEKNLETLIRIYQEAENQQLDYNFIVIGNGVAKTALENAMPKAHFLGHIDHQELSQMYASADVFLFPSDTESYGNVVIEAMASGLPCVIANGGGSGSLVQDGQNGLSCPPQAEKAYLSAIQQILTNAKLKDRLIVNGLSYTKDLEWPQLAKRYFEQLSLLTPHTRDNYQLTVA